MYVGVNRDYAGIYSIKSGELHRQETIVIQTLP